jgi:hypothetical protein
MQKALGPDGAALEASSLALEHHEQVEKTIRVFRNHEEARRHNAGEGASAPMIACERRSRFTNGTTAMIPPLNKEGLELVESFNAKRVEPDAREPSEL